MQHAWRTVRLPFLLTSAVIAGACSDALPTGPGARADAGPAFSEMAAAAWDGQIRIGVVPTAASVTIGSAGDFTITNEGGDALGSGAGGTVTVTTAGLPPVTHWWLQVSCAFDPAGLPPLIAIADAHDVPWMTEPHPTVACTRLLVGDRTGTDGGFTARNNYEAAMILIGLAPADGSGFWHSRTVGETVYRFTLNGATVDSRTPVILTSSTGLVTINGAPYRGAAVVVRNSAGSLAGVNKLWIEDYLLGVLPRELPPVPYDEIEAQKAQAVSARTYAIRGLGKRSVDGYDLLPTTSDQVYSGYAVEHPLSTQAVRETEGIVATYGGTLIEALFSSTSGGFTAGNEEVYNSAPVPYLRPRTDAQRGASLEHAPDHAIFKYDKNASSLRGFKGGDYEADWSRYHRWTFTWTADEISQVVSLHAQQPVGRVLAINVLERGKSGRVQRIEYVTEAGTFYDAKDHIRTSLKFVNASGTLSSLLSTLFYIDPVVDKATGEVSGFVAYGGGWGHGVGLAQTGAVGMAEKGATYEEILKHYYTGIDLETRY
ncbi:MAG TPA: SpoIID/LytB domain-containing protein [Gemmatimonadaceae bacterium]